MAPSPDRIIQEKNFLPVKFNIDRESESARALVICLPRSVTTTDFVKHSSEYSLRLTLA